MSPNRSTLIPLAPPPKAALRRIGRGYRIQKRRAGAPIRTPAPNRTALCWAYALLALLSLGGLLGLPGTALGRLYSPLPPGEHRVHKVHVGVYRLPGERLRSLRLALLLVGQLLGSLPVLLGLSVQVVDGLVEEDLSNLGVALLGGDAAFGDRLVGLNEGVCKLLGGLVYPLLALLVGHKARYHPSCCYSW